MSQKYVEIWEASKSSRNVLNIGICWQLKVYTWIFLIGFGYLGVLNTYLEWNGFHIIHKYGGFEEEAFDDNSAKQIFICQCDLVY